MSTDFDSLCNRGEYFAAHYFAEQLGDGLKKGLFATWTSRENDEHDPRRTPRQGVRDLRSAYLSDRMRSYFAACAEDDETDDQDVAVRLRTYGNPQWHDRLREWHLQLLAALGFCAPERDDSPSTLTVHRAGRDHQVEVAWHGDGIVALECGWTGNTDSALDADGPGRLRHPVRVSASESYETGPALATWLFQSELDRPGGRQPRFVLLLCGGVIILADRQAWAEGRFLAANLDTALERNDRKQFGELATIAALFSYEMLRPGEDDVTPSLDAFLKASTDNAVGVSGELRDGLQKSVEIIANEVLARLDLARIEPRQIERPDLPFARELTRESLRYLYRILFLLYAEARPELGILPADDGSYEAGYSVARLRELVARDEQLVEEEAKNSFHLFTSLAVLFEKVNNGHRIYGTEEDDDQPDDDEETRILKAKRRSEDRGLRFEALRSELFEPHAVRLIGRGVDHPSRGVNGSPEKLDLRLRNTALHEVLRLLTMKKASRRGDRGGFISYRNLGINQLGAVYEGLMSYTGIIATEELCEVAKGGDPDKGSWLVPAHRQQNYPEQTLVTYDEHDARKGLRGPKRYKPGTFVYRLAGRDRETTASYYTPESLTKVTVELALKHRLDQERDAQGEVIRTRAAELLRYKICEPALGSGAFLNEAINQVAEEYLRRRQDERKQSVPTADVLTEKQKVKAYIALHNAYGVDLNATGVELAEVSLWLNTMHPGMRAPWFGLHLRRGNSLIGARRTVFAGKDVLSADKAWLKAKDALGPTPLPFRKNDGPQPLPDDAVHQFLLPAPGWAAVTGSKEAKALADKQLVPLATWKKGILQRPKKTQFTRLRDAARRAEYLWSLVIQRMELSERAIARRIDVWGADGEEFGFLGRSAEAATKEQVFRDLFDAVDTPYWRLKTVMDAWCALWFWPADKAALLDGSAADYREPDGVESPESLAALLGGAPLVGAPEPGTKPKFPRVEDRFALFSVAGEQASLLDLEPDDDAEFPVESQVIKPRGGSKAKPAPVRRRKAVPLRDLDDWLAFLEAMLGTNDVPEGSFITQFDDLEQLKTFEAQLPSTMGMDTGDPEHRFPWLHTVRDIAADKGFLHWELEFALVFAQGGFDLQVGNPPWVRPRWNESAVLAEHEPWFELEEKPDLDERTERRKELLREPAFFRYVLREQTDISAQVALFGSSQVYPLLVGTQPNLYRAFMSQVWAHACAAGVSGMVHPDTHFTGDKEGKLRAAAYRRLRVHGDFFNPGHRFFQRPVGESSHFGVHVYGSAGPIAFDHLSWLVSADSLRYSVRDDVPNGYDDSDEGPGIRRDDGKYDDRPHEDRVIKVDLHKLTTWQRLLDEDDQPVEQARLLFPVSTAEANAIEALASYPLRLDVFDPEITRGYDESGAKKDNLIAYNRRDVVTKEEYQPKRWRRVVLKGIQLGVATPIFKRYDANTNDPYGADLVSLADDFVPSTEYVRVPGRTLQYLAAQDRWIDYRALARLRQNDEALARARREVARVDSVPEEEVDPERVYAYLVSRAHRRCTVFTRLAWRRQIAPDTERALYPALIPPGTAHVDAVHSLTVGNLQLTALVAGFWASLPLDYFLRITGRGDLRVAGAKAMPTPVPGHPLGSALLLRTLRLNCLTNAYTKLWEELYEPAWRENERWVCKWPGLPPLEDVTPDWRRETPLRSERARRSALVEIDALVAVWLGMDADALIAAYRGRFPVLQKYEAVTWFDAEGWKIAGNARTIGQRQTKESWAQFQKHLEDKENVPPPHGYTAPFHKADREAEMREAHAVFQARLDAAIQNGEWDPAELEVPQS
jgi:hypothetical protein